MFFSSTKKSAPYKTISAETAKKVLKDDKGSAVLLDVRTPEEFASGHIPGATLIPDYELSQRAETELPNTEAPIIVYCLSGGRSGGAARWLLKKGYTNVYDLGSIHNWR